MSTGSSYNNDLAKQMENVPMPNIDLAWADMKKRLEEKEEEKPLVPFWLNSCALWALLAVILLGVAGWFLYKNNSNKNLSANNKTDSTTITNKNIVEQTVNTSNNNEKALPKNNIVTQNEIINKKNEITNATPTIKNSISKNYRDNYESDLQTKDDDAISPHNYKKEKNKQNLYIPSKGAEIANDEKLFSKNKLHRKTKGKAKTNITESEVDTDKTKINTAKNNNSNRIDSEDNKETTTKELIKQKENVNIINESNNETAKTNVAVISPDNQKVYLDNKVKKDTNATKDKIKIKQKSKYFFSSGLGIQQALPINGEKITPYTSLGREGSLLDYIPSIYTRFEKDKKWFIQAEAKYGAPQYNKEFAFNQVSKKDTGFFQNFTNQTTKTLKKSFYHQVPLSFNYYLKPNWSIGTGVQWNNFAGAYYNDISKRIFTPTDSTVAIFKNINVFTKADSFNVFKKSYFLGLVETQYRWRRFTFGAKYTFGLSPYITFTLPSQTEQKLTSNNATVFVKYELYSTRKKKK